MTDTPRDDEQAETPGADAPNDVGDDDAPGIHASAPAREDEAEVARAEVEAVKEREAQTPHLAPDAGTGARVIAAVTGTSVIVTLLAVLTALVLGAVIIAFSDDGVREALGYVTARPSDFFSRAWDEVWASYRALFNGALGGPSRISETLVSASPLILAGLAVAIPLRAGLFNIGGEGQVIGGGLVAGYVGFALDGLPMVVHLPLALAAGLLGGAIVGFVPGILKARTGAHEVIITIMLNNTLLLVTEWLLSSVAAFRQPGRSDPISRTVVDSARLPQFVPDLRVTFAIIVALAVAAAIYWFIERSTTGFELNAVGLNAAAATTAGMSPAKMTMLAMSLGGAMAGLAGADTVLGVQGRITGGFSAGLGFDGITVALLGRGRIGGTVAAGLLFGALKAGGRAMQGATGTSLDLVLVIQALIIVFIAAPLLVRAVFRIKADDLATGQVAKGWGQ